MMYEYAQSADILRTVGDYIYRSSYYIISGTVGAGKTTLLEELARQEQRLRFIPEVAAELINEQVDVDGELVPWKNELAFHKFEDLLLRKRVEAYLSGKENELCFFDRGIPDAIPFFQVEGKSVPTELIDAARKVRYNQMVFFLPFWEEIYENTPFRPQSVKEAASIDILLRQTYIDLGYTLVDVPKASAESRTQFILEQVGIL